VSASSGPPPDSPGSVAGASGPAVALELLGVRASYGAIEVLHDVDLRISAGEVFALLGPNGAGKSTILKVVGGRLRPTGGSVMVFGELVGRRPADQLVALGVCSLPEGRGVFPNLTVTENLLMWTYSAGGGKAALADIEQRAFDRFPRLAGRRQQLAGSLSGGEQQMLAVARAFAARPRLLLLDEISMGLAPNLVAELFDVVRQLAGEGVTVVLAEQFVHAALGLATRAAVVVHGRVAAVDDPTTIAETVSSAYLAGAPAAPRS
jgi:branched-chain amino acid transport system ATP-binding protein